MTVKGGRQHAAATTTITTIVVAVRDALDQNDDNNGP